MNIFHVSMAGLVGGARPRRAGPLGLIMAGEGGGGGFHHVTVMPEETMVALQPGPGKIYLDLTLGGGGHSERLLQAGAEVWGLDQDAAALAAARARLAVHGQRFHALKGNFGGFAALCREHGAGPFDGILMDLGVSSHQLDTPERGFSFQREGPLDMRMNSEEGLSAADLVNGAAEEELTKIFRELGEEPQARRVARAVVAARTRKPLATTLDLANLIEQTLGRRGAHHPATKVFQALRIAVNGELAALERALAASKDWLRPGGRLVVISFHSLEDRICKMFIRHHSVETLDRPEWPSPRANPECWFREIGRKPLEATEDEVKRNPRSRSAKLRVAEKRDH